jgi:hypothetical protein
MKSEIGVPFGAKFFILCSEIFSLFSVEGGVEKLFSSFSSPQVIISSMRIFLCRRYRKMNKK